MIDTQAIRSKILDLAMRGKLTEQLPEDGTAEALYRQIQKEKQNLIIAGKIKKEKPLPEIADGEIPFEIPRSWKWVRLGALLRVISGISYEKSDISTNGLRILRGGNIQNMGITLDQSDVFLPFPYKDDDKVVRKGDVIIVASTGSETAIGRAGYADSDYKNTMIGAFLRICRPIVPESSMYIRAIFMSDYYLQHIRREAKGTNINNVKEKYITQFVVPIPPLAEQKRIVAKIEQAFSALDTIDALQAKYADNLAVLKSKLIDAAIQGKLTEQLPEDGTAEELYRQIQAEKQSLINAGKIKKEKPLPEIAADEIPFEIPATWKWVSLGNITSKISSGNTPPGGSKSDVYVQSGFPLFREQNIYDDGIHQAGMVFISERLLETRQNSTVNAKDILLNITGGSIGRCALVPDDFDKGSINQHILIIRTVEPETRFYIHMLICSSYIQSHIKNKAVGDKDGFSGGRCKRMLVPLPPLAEQKRIVAKLEELLLLCERLK